MSAEDILKKAHLANSAVGYWDTPDTQKTQQDYQALEFHRLRVEADQAYASGLITDEERERYYTGDRTNIIQSLLQLDGPGAHNTGGTLETISDVLSLPNYLVASLSKGVTEGIKGDRGIDLGLFKVGFSPSAFTRAWSNKTDFVKMFDEYGFLGEEGGWGNFAGGLAADILLDPTNVLTFGVSTGTKVALSEGTPLAAKVLSAQAGAHVDTAVAGVDATLTRFGSKIYKLAARDLANDLAMQHGSRLNDLGENVTLLDELTAREFHQQIGNRMVEQFDRLKAEAARIQREGRHGVIGRMGAVVPGSETQLDLIVEAVKSAAGVKAEKILSMTAEDMFQETASVLNKDRGVKYNFTNFQKATAEIPGIGKYIAGVYDTFDHGWDAPPDVVALQRQYKASIKNAEAQYFDYADRELGGETVEDLEAITRYVEARGLARNSEAHLTTPQPSLSEGAVLAEPLKQGTIGTFAPLSDKMAANVNWMIEELAKIEAEEVAHFGTDVFGHIEVYVPHIYKDPRARDMVMEAIKRNGEVSVKSANRFHHTRMIATINQVEEMYDGANPLLMNALEILKARKRASINLIASDIFLTKIAKDHGYAAKILAELRNPMPSGLFRGLMRRAAVGSSWVTDIDQTWEDAKGNLTRLGFKKGDSTFNRNLIEYLQQPLTEEGRFSPKWSEFAKRHGIKEDARLHPNVLPTELSWDDLRKERREGGKAPEVQSDRPRFAVGEVLKWFDDPNHPAWRNVMSSTVGGEDFSMEKLSSLIRALDAYTMKHLDTPLEGLDPNIRGKLEAVIWKRLDLSGGKQVKDVNDYFPTFTEAGQKRIDQLNDLFDSLAHPREVRKLDPQLPQAFVDLLAAQRRHFGIYTDTAPPDEITLENIRKQAGRLGLSADNMRDIYRRLFNKDSIDSAKEAHAVERVLMGNVYGNEQAAAKKMKAVNLTFTVNRKTSLMPELMPPQGIPTGEARLPSNSAAGRVLKETAKTANMAGEVAPEAAGVFDTAAYRAETGGGERVVGSGSLSTLPSKDPTAATRKLDVKLRLQQGHVVESGEEYHQRLDQLYKLGDQVREYDRKLGVYKAARDEQKRAKDAFDAAPARSAERKAKRDVWRAAVDARNKALGELKAAGEPLRPLRLKKPDPTSGRPITDRDVSLGKTTEKSADLLLNKEVRDLKNIRNQLSREMKLLKDWTNKSVKEGEGSFKSTKQGRPVGESQTGGISRTERIKDRAVYDEAGNRVGSEGYMDIPKTYRHKIYTDAGTAKIIEDLQKPDIDPLWPDAVKQLVLGYDKITSYYKANLLLPWSGTWMRNGIGSVAMAYLKAGGALFHKDHAKDYWKGLLYVLDGYTNVGSSLGIDTSKWAAYGDEVVTTKLGQSIKIRNLIDSAAKVGVFSTQIGDEVLKAPSLRGRFAAGLSGAAAGALAGQSAGTFGEMIGQVTSGQEPEGGWFAPSNLGAMIGAVAGAHLGARKMRTRPEFGGKKALMSTDWWTGVMQNNWKPFLRAGELATEMPVRMMLFMTEFKETGSIAEAAKGVADHLNDWNNLSVTERRYIRRAIPFYSWTKHAFKQTAHTLAERPDRLINILKTVRDWNQSEGVDPEDVPDYIQDKLVMATDNLGTKWAVYNSGMPIETVADVARMLPGSSELNKEMIEAVDTVVRNSNFMLQSGIEIMTNRDSYTGESIDSQSGVYTTRFMDGEKWETSPQWLKALVGYRPADSNNKAVVNPQIAWVLGEVPVSRFINVAKQIYETDNTGDLNYVALSRTVLGASLYKVDPVTGRFFENRARMDKMKNLLAHVGALKTFEGFADVNKEDDDYSVSGRHQKK
jgi:hypothetical protein